MVYPEKKRIRQLVKQLKVQMSDEEKTNHSAIIFNAIEQTSEFKQAKIVVMYWSMPDEVYTHGFIEKWKHKKTILLPVINGDNLDFKIYTSENSMVPGQQFGIAEPGGSIFTNLSAIELIIVPGIAFDKKNNRMGRGKGFYDKFLSKAKAIKIGICFNCQLLENIPCEEHDIKMDKVISC